MDLPPHVFAAAVHRAHKTRESRRCALQHLLARNPVALEPDGDRLIRRIAYRVRVDHTRAAALAAGADPASLELGPEQVIAAKSVIGQRNFLPVSFLARGRRASNAVGRLVRGGDTEAGTCFMISRELLITNNHLIATTGSAESVQVEFELDVDASGTPGGVARFGLNHKKFFVTDSALTMDFTVIALGDPVSAGSSAARLAFCRLSGRNDKHALGDFVNIIQYPSGGHKQVVVRENHLVIRPEMDDGSQPVLQYTADTLDNSSGAPVFNDEWDVMALHHSSVKAGEITVGGHTRLDVVNEGTRASVIVEALRSRRSTLSKKKQTLLDEALRE